ncbi:hypothetical protein BDP27DRAFT_1485534 [Rhodocollybia butyracea]|uniref:Terpenoid synthase n=1 Tax=Rhodocollybia butyracea TaxID=206335 RepID=A0A9P5PFG1_9AGAR|nr:hypothetical protein BDP27DRAFT_1485534 [Rhodocollybia butyracea]
MSGDARSFEVPLSALEKDTSKDYVSRLQLLFREINFRYVAPLPPSTDFLHSYHNWIHNTLGPMTSWTTSQLDILEDTTFTIAERPYPFADIEMKAIIAKLTALVIFIDDSLETNTVGIYDEIGSFAHHLLMGESQPSAILELYHKCIKELVHLYEGDAVQRGLATVPWINFIDGCLLEKRLFTMDAELRASRYDMGYQNLAKQGHSGIDHAARDTSPGAKIHFPLFIRHKTGVGEAYAAAVFKSTKEQSLPLSRYIMAIPDMNFYIVSMPL